jgi:hypothetical protein
MKRRKPRNKRQPRGAQQEESMRGLAAINRARSENSGYLNAAIAQAEGTSLGFIRRQFPKALFPSRSGERLRVRPTDPYSWPVEILNDSGLVQVVTAHGSQERKLAGQHRADYMGVLRNTRPASILRKYRGKTVGGQKLLTDPDLLFELAEGSVIDNLMPLYVSPE